MLSRNRCKLFLTVFTLFISLGMASAASVSAFAVEDARIAMMPNPAVSPARDGAGNLLARERKNAPDRADCLSLPLEGEPGFAWFAGAGELAAGNAEIVNPAPVAQIGSAPCNLQAPWVNNATFDNISATVIDDVVSLGCLVGSNVSNIGNLSNGDTTDSATFQMTGLNCDATLSVEDTNDTYPAGAYAGFKVSSDSLLDVSVGFDVTIETWNGGALQESQAVVSSLVGVDASLLDGSGDVVLGFVTAQDFDEVRIVYEAAVGVLVTGEVYHAVVEPFCAGAALPCNTVTSMTAPDYPVIIDSGQTGVGAVACVGCSVTNAENVINDDETDAASIVLTTGVLDASGSVAVRDVLTDYAAGFFAGFDIENAGLSDLSLLQGVTVETFLGGASQESATGGTSLLTADTSLLSGDTRMTVGFVTTLPFDEVKLTVSNPVLGVNLGSTLVYRAVFKSLCELSLSCDQTYYLSEPDFPVIIDSGLTGVEGVACVGCVVDDSAAVISSDQNDFATITLPAGVAASGSIAVLDPIETFPEGSIAGFTIRDVNSLLEGDLFDSLTICTYNDGAQMECSGGDLLNVSLLLNWGATAGLQDVGFATTLPFDEIRITVDPLVNAGLGDNEIEVYSAFLDTRTATGGDLFCRDTDGDGIRDNVDIDDDGDGIPDLQEGDGGIDTDGDGVPNSRDLDSDNDGINDVDEGGDGALDTNDDGQINSDDTGFADDNGDGQADASVDVNEEPNSDGDGVPDYRDLDSDNDGISDVVEAGYGAFDGDNDGMVDVSGTNDSDGDGIQDAVDGAPGAFGDAADPAPLDTDGDGIPDYRDQDGDNDGIPDSEEGSGNVDTDGDGVPNSRDLDSDNDGINDVDEGGDGALDTNDDGQINSDDAGFADGNGDGQANASVDVNEEPNSDGDSVPDYRDLDSDNDGISDVVEAGYAAFDGDTDGMVDVSGTNDSDGDGIQDGVDGAPGVFGDAADPAPLDTDGDGIPDYRDQDGDNDGIPDSEEGSGNVDTDGDGVPNSRDLDSDNDGVNDVDEGGDGALDTNDDGQINSDDTGFADDNGDGQADASVDAEEEPDGDGDSVPDYRDLDSNNDGISDVVEAGYGAFDGDNDGMVDVSGTNDSDGDGIQDAVDGAPGVFGDTADPAPLDTDGDGIPDYRDQDGDNDGIPDSEEGSGNVDTDGDGVPNSRDLDSDNDGINDVDEGGDGALDTNGDGRINSDDTGFADDNGDGQADASVNTDGGMDTEGDGVPDYRDLDSDNDGLNDVVEAGYGVFDGNDDGMIDASGTNDSDGDGIQDGVDGAPGAFGDADDPTPVNTDNGGVPDYRDLDGDNDGINDVTEAGHGSLDGNHDGMVDASGTNDSDGDGIRDGVDGAPGVYGDADDPAPINTDGDALPDHWDLDCDNNGINDVNDDPFSGSDNDGDGMVDGDDFDGDGIHGPADGDDNIFGDVLPVTYRYILAERRGETVYFAWETLTESDIAGFNLHMETSHDPQLINPDPIPSPVNSSLEPIGYAYDAAVQGDSYYLEEIGLEGRARLHGPFSIGVVYGEGPGDDAEQKIFLPYVHRQ